MRFFLASTSSALHHGVKMADIMKSDFFLESFYNLPRGNTFDDFKKAKMFLLDSGAYSFIHACGENLPDVDEYLDRYISFVKEKDIDYFFDLDIEEFIGYDKVLKNRKKIEREVNRQPIPVWHRPLGVQAFIDMCDEYDYVAIAGFTTNVLDKKTYPAVAKMIQIAHARGCKVHGLGFGRTDLLQKMMFDSADSSTWLQNGIYGHALFFDKGTSTIRYCRSSRKYFGMKSSAPAEKIIRNNLDETIRFQQYAKHKVSCIWEEDMRSLR